MNTFGIAEQLSELPDGLLVENRRQRVTVILGLSSGLLVPMPSNEVAPGELRHYFYANVEEVESILYKINEAIPFALDRALEIGYRAWHHRHSVSFNPNSGVLFEDNPIKTIAPETGDLKIGRSDVDSAMALIREGLCA